ncbi:NAD-glutamate dehydrogenase [Chitinibacter bivalviorum]|uniref:NAD-glutamate dehydrogenase n=1 Tax=Chitinibacter bivalviorum TaxID=2739434 RepID=A0A7H9BIB6_9NEIS|nr:NAD-glutamate dehydrogenase [Chitinibacter bivalviorum]QLG87691.1 NAD-glutamate dehydrogenase [Chitinibacter bivalviorum]
MSIQPRFEQLHDWMLQQGLQNIDHLIAQYFADTPEDEWSERSTEDWGGALLAHWRFGQKRPPDQPCLRIYNPNQNEHGWECAHTVIEIITDDMPFLVDSVGMALNRLKYNAFTVIHPVLTIQRDTQGQIAELESTAIKESWMHFEITRISDPQQLLLLETQIKDALSAISAAVNDWSKMASCVAQALENLRLHPSPLPAHNIKETIAFIEWLLAGHYVFLGVRQYAFEAGELIAQANTGLGLLRDSGSNATSKIWSSLSAELRDIAYANERLLMLTKSDRRSIIHRPAYLDTILLRQYDEQGQITGEIRMIGLYSASAYTTQPRQIPILRLKIDEVLRLNQVDLSGYRGKALLNTLDTYPRDELIEIETPELSRIALGIVSLHERSRVRAFFRDDIYRRYVSVMVFVPRDNYSTEVRVKIESLLLNKLNGSSAEYTVLLGDAPLARIQYIIRRLPEARSSYNSKEIEQEIAQLAQRWPDELRRELIHTRGEELGAQLFQRYQTAFSAAYSSDFSPRIAVHDIEALEQSRTAKKLVVSLSAGSALNAHIWRIKLFRHQAIELSDCLPLLENLGLRVADERPYQINASTGDTMWIMDIGIRLPANTSLEDAGERTRLIDAFIALFNAEAENDSFNRLTLVAGLAWREVVVLRAYARFLKQVAFKYAIESIADCLLKYPSYSKQLVNAFMLMQHPHEQQEAVAEIVLEEVEQAAKVLPNADEERILTGFIQAIRATLRSNYFQLVDGHSKSYLSLKIASPLISFMPQPVPMCEIFVYSPQIEGVHLRGGKVARGGLRWSDRREDFRTEVLGLVKAQMVKNTVIVPVGSKGGFIVKNPPSEREAFQAAGIACYQTFIRGLLDLTDNLIDGVVIPPLDVRRRDADDPYLVVAADKGTATFSDIANAISQQYGFWLDDAFASGGSVGYDHKKMGITARGAWISVERSFRELGVNTRTEAFTAVGIGDMSGDVFGNGLLRSPHTQLVAAFDHRHIFIDPSPDASRSFTERERLFALPRSSWADYDASLISAGGGIWPRSAKSIPISPQVSALLGIEAEQLEPVALIQAILKAPVDLLYNGGIGTYVKACTQSHSEANDRGNDGLRVDGRDLRCKVIAEGGNLGFTQLGRIEYAAHGGRIHTDAIDNSAGVDCSDHEVNIKILLGRLIATGDLTLKQRNDILASMTEEVGHLVLRDNELQTLAISLENKQAKSLLSVHTRMMQTLEKTGKLSRRIEYLPTDSQLADRQAAGLGLYPPELAVILAYAKIVLNQELLAEDLVDQERWNDLLTRYFPSTLRERFSSAIPAHPLRREIIATQLCNHAINRFGMSCIFRLQEETEQTASEIVDALLTSQQLLDGEALALAVEALDGLVPAEIQTELQLQIRRYTERIARWLLQHPLSKAESDHLHTCAALTLPKAPEWLAGSARYMSQKNDWVNAGVPAELAMRILVLQEIQALLEMARKGNDTGQLAERLQLHLALGDALDIHWLHHEIERLPRENRWQTLARMAVRDDLSQMLTSLTEYVWQAHPGEDCLNHWLDEHTVALKRIEGMFNDLRSATPDLAMISAAIRELRHRLCVK